MEGKKERKIQFLNAEHCGFSHTYFDPGSFAPAAGYNVTSIVNGTLTAGSNQLNQPAHTHPIVDGDLVRITSASSSNDVRETVLNAAASDVNNIGMDQVAQANSVTNVSATVYQSNIEFGASSNMCYLVGGASLSQNAVTDRGRNNMVLDPELGFARGNSSPQSFQSGGFERQGGLDINFEFAAECFAYFNQNNTAGGAVGHRFQAKNSDGVKIPIADVLAYTSARVRNGMDGVLAFRTADQLYGNRTKMMIDHDGVLVHTQGASNARGTANQFMYEIDPLNNTSEIEIDTTGTKNGMVLVSGGVECMLCVVQGTTVAKVVGTTNTAVAVTPGSLALYWDGNSLNVRNDLGVGVPVMVMWLNG